MEKQYYFYNKTFILDRKLYKYFSDETIDYVIDCINNKRIHLDNPNSFNDPFDDSVPNSGVGMDGRDEYSVNGLLKWGKVSCFSEINNSILMWSYYANKHKGLCLEFDLNKLDQNKSINKQILDNIGRVQYSPIRPKGDIFDISNNNFRYTKANVWAHECEWRIVCDTKEEYLPFDCVSGIIIGASFYQSSEKYKYKKLFEIAKENNLIVFRCRLDEEEYKIKVIPIEQYENLFYSFEEF